MKITSIDSNGQYLDGGSMFGNAPRPVWEKWIPPDERGRIPLACRSFLVKIDGKNVLLETGIGAFFEPKLADRFGIQNADTHMLLKNLRQVGINENDIDFVILSHLHFDHAGGLLPTYSEINDTGLRVLFSNATYVVGKHAWERALNPHSRDKASFLPQLNKLLKNSQRLQIIDDNRPQSLFNNKLTFRFSSGHTPGQMHTVLNGEETKAVFAGDLVPGQPWVHLPITMGYDRFPEKVIDEKQELYNQAVPEEWLFLYTHDPYVTSSKVIQNEGGRYTPYDPNEKLVEFSL